MRILRQWLLRDESTLPGQCIARSDPVALHKCWIYEMKFVDQKGPFEFKQRNHLGFLVAVAASI